MSLVFQRSGACSHIMMLEEGRGGEDQVSGNDAGTLFSWSRIANILNGSESF